MGVHEDARRRIGGRNEALSLCDIEAHAVHEDDGEEVGDGVGGGGAKAKERGKAPDLEVAGVAEVLAEAELGGDGVSAVLLDARDHEVDLLIAEEAAGALGLVGEVDEEEVAGNADTAGEDTFHLGGGQLKLHRVVELALTMKIHRHPSSPARPFICIRPYARIPAKADAPEPIR